MFSFLLFCLFEPGASLCSDLQVYICLFLLRKHMKNISMQDQVNSIFSVNLCIHCSVDPHKKMLLFSRKQTEIYTLFYEFEAN